MPDGFGGQRRPVPFAVTNPERIPTKRYYDEAFFEAEAEHLWPHAWQMACRLEQIQNVGDWTEYTILGKSVLIVRTKDGVKAFHNVCRHRGVRLGRGHGNCKSQGFICPFHGWRWNMDGKNTFVYGKHLFSEQALDPNDIALKPCRVELWGGCAFINFDDNAPPLLEYFGPTAERLTAHAVDKLRTEWWFATVLPANWKVGMEAFMEGYHTMRTHPQLQNATPNLFNSMYGYDNGGVRLMADPNMSVKDNIENQIRAFELLSEGMGGLVQAKEIEIARQVSADGLPADPQQAMMMWLGMVQDRITKDLRAQGEPVPDLNAVAVSHPLQPVEFLFPHYFLLPTFTSFSSYRVRPLGPESCMFELWSLTMYPEGKEPPPVQEPTMLPYNSKTFPPIPQQDYTNIPEQQVGMHAEGFEFMRLAKNVEGLISNFHRLVDGYIAGAPADKLKAATASIGSNFDGPIRDLGL